MTKLLYPFEASPGTHSDMMRETLSTHPKQAKEPTEKKRMTAYFSHARLNDDHPSLIHYSSTPLFRLEKRPEKYAHLLKKKDRENIVPIINYLIGNSGHVVYLGGDTVKNLYLHGRRKYKLLTILAILTDEDLDKFSSIMNNIISSNDGAFSMGFRYRVKKNRIAGCFKDLAHARYLIEPRLEGLEKLLYLFRPSTLELDLTTQQKFFHTFGIEVQ